MKKFKVFNIEFDGMDKTGKDTIMKQIFSYCPNKYIPKSRGFISQIAYSKMFNREYFYEVAKGYCENTLFVYLTVDEDDWNVRCKMSGEHELNKTRSDVERKIEYQESKECFDYGYDELIEILGGFGISERHVMKFNTSKETPINIIKAVCERLEELNA